MDAGGHQEQMTSDKERSPRVVLADDHPTVLSAFARILRAYCCDVVAAASTGTEAIDAVIMHRPDVLVVDLMMGDLDGLEVCRRVKRAVPETDVVIVTAFSDTAVQAVAMQDGATAFVPKHEAAETLVKTIHRIFADKQQRSGTG
jgi:DNA-binding NarL/FixJ family response regulator